MSRLRKNCIACFQPIKFEKIMDQPIRAKQASVPAPWRDMTQQSQMALWSPFSENTRVFSKLSNLSQNFSNTDQNNQSGRFPVLQEEKLEWQKKHK